MPFIEYARSWGGRKAEPAAKDGAVVRGPGAAAHVPSFGVMTIQDITEPHVRRWRKALLDAELGEVTVAKVYRLLKAIRVWRRATESAGLTGFHFHDLRHAGNHISTATGASLRELMGRMGHGTTRAALIYQHRTTERDRLIAAAMSEIVQAELGEITVSSGTYRARGHRDAS
jgi:hypothetical protein